jgi:hypothetical protein
MALRRLAAALGCSLALAASARGAEPSTEALSEAPRAAVALAPETAEPSGPEQHMTAQEAAQPQQKPEEPDALTVIGTGAATVLLALVLLVFML